MTYNSVMHSLGGKFSLTSQINPPSMFILGSDGIADDILVVEKHNIDCYKSSECARIDRKAPLISFFIRIGGSLSAANLEIEGCHRAIASVVRRPDLLLLCLS